MNRKSLRNTTHYNLCIIKGISPNFKTHLQSHLTSVLEVHQKYAPFLDKELPQKYDNNL